MRKDIAVGSLIGIFMCLVTTLLLAAPAKETPGAEDAAAAASAGDGQLQVYTTLTDYLEATGRTIGKYNEAPMLATRVAAGELPPVEDRIPEDVMVLDPIEIGEYGGRLVGHAYPGTRTWGYLGIVFLYESFLRTGPDANTIIPNLATNVELSADGKTLDLYMRRGVNWSDGTPFTADDVMFVYHDVLLNDELATQMGMQRQFWSPTDEPAEVVKIDDYHVRFTFPEPYPVARYHFTFELGLEGKIILPKHYFLDWHIKYNPDADSIAKEKGLDRWYELFSTWGAITGRTQGWLQFPTIAPYVVTEDEPGFIAAERNPYYWKVDTDGNQLPYIDRLLALQNIEGEVAAAKAMAGEFDYARASLDDYVLLRENEKAGNYKVHLWNVVGSTHFGLQINQTYAKDLVLRDIFRDVRFRRALSVAINRDEINEVLFQGLGVPGQATVSPKTSFYEEEFARAYADYDPESANAMLDEMGLDKRDGEGYRLRPDGKRLSVVIEYGNFFKSTMFELTKEYWEAVGVEVTIVERSLSLAFKRYPANEVEIGGWAQDDTHEMGFLTLHNFFVPNGWDGYNNTWPLWLQWRLSGGEKGEEPPAEVKRNIERSKQMLATLDAEERVRLGKEILRSQAENIWVIGLVGYPPIPIVTRANLRNIPEAVLLSQGVGESYLSPSTFFLKSE